MSDIPYVPPVTVVSEELITVQKINEQWQGNIEFLANPPACRVYHNTTQSIPNGADTVVLFNSERYDTDNMHSTATNTGRINFPTAGIYLLKFSGELQAAGDYTTHYAYFRINGLAPIDVGTAAAVTNGIPGCETSVVSVYKFAAGDFVEVLMAQRNGANAARTLQTVGNYTPEMSATWIGLG